MSIVAIGAGQAGKKLAKQLTIAVKEEYVEFEVHALEDGWI